MAQQAQAEAVQATQQMAQQAQAEAVQATQQMVQQAQAEAVQVAQQMVQQAQAEAVQVAQQMVQQAQAEAVQVAQQLVQQAAEQMTQQTTELSQEIKYLKSNSSQQNRLFDIILNDKKSLSLEPFNDQQLKEIQDEKDHLLDSFYVAFEDKFRGTRKEIKERVKVYLPMIAQVNSCISDFSILDIGCGRGEWLELLQESGYSAFGVDINKTMVEQCQERGFEVVGGDAIAYLRTLPDASLGVVTGFHIIEHLSIEVVAQLLDETLRVLKPGGGAIFETPNPQNIIVGSCNFYLDPTHIKPLPSPMIKFMVEERGFDRVEIMNLHPVEELTNQTNDGYSERFFALHVYGPQDYSVIGYKK